MANVMLKIVDSFSFSSTGIQSLRFLQMTFNFELE